MDIYYKTFLTVDGITEFFNQNPQHKLINIETTLNSGNYLFRVWFNSGDNIAPKQTNYQVFEVNDCFEEYSISYNLVGAIDENDLIEHLYEVGKELNLTKKQVKNIIKDKDWRIKRIEHLFTDTPYIILDGVGYME